MQTWQPHKGCILANVCLRSLDLKHCMLTFFNRPIRPDWPCRKHKQDLVQKADGRSKSLGSDEGHAWIVVGSNKQSPQTVMNAGKESWMMLNWVASVLHCSSWFTWVQNKSWWERLPNQGTLIIKQTASPVIDLAESTSPLRSVITCQVWLLLSGNYSKTW